MRARAAAIVTKRGGEVLDKEPEAGRLWVRCGAGHEWQPRTKNLLYRASWCPECYGNKPLTIEAIRELAVNRGGECLSEEYRGLTAKLRWKCAAGHEWEATPNNVKNHGSWCPHCRTNVGEELVRATFEEAFPGHLFDRTRQEPWMAGLELDGFNPELRLAFEYQGKQHYERVEVFQPNEGDFEAQLERDRLTEERCFDELVTLLVIPFTVGFAGLRDYVRGELADLGYAVSPAVGASGEFYDRVRARGPDMAHQLARVAEVALQKGGVCLSEQYVGYRVPMRFRCRAGHEFEATPEAIDQPASRGPRFCPECGGTRRQEDAELRAKVEACGFRFLGVESRGDAGGRSRRYIAVECPAGHEYEVSWDNFAPRGGIPKKGCAACHHARVGASKRGDISKWCERTGVRPTAAYTSSAANCEWVCAAGHTFTAKHAVLRGKATPCTECALHAFAAEKGLALETAWTRQSGPTAALDWRCLECGSVFSMTWASANRKKRLCPKCA